MSRKVLVVDDEKLIVKGIRFSLEQDGMEVDCAYDGEEAVEKAKDKKYDIILLDLMLPKMDGLEVCQQIREFSNVPIVMLTAKGEDMDKILGLEYGADDYITKPFNILEVKARIKAIMRRTAKRKEEPAGSPVLVKGNMKIDCEGRRVFIGEREINLTAKEFDVLELLAMNPNKVYSRENLLNLIWGYEYPGDARTVELALYVRRIVREIGALVAVLGGLDMLVFTAGVGEHNAFIRERICAALGFLGIALDTDANARHAAKISSDHSQVTVAVEPTNEEWIAASHALSCLDREKAR